MTRKHLYTSFSRVTSLNGLFINGKYKPPPPPSKFDMSQQVIQKMKNESYLTFNITSPNTYPYAVFHNIRSLNMYFKYVLSHPLYKKAEILMFAETRFKQNENHDIPHYICIHRNDCIQNYRHAYGTAVYVKKTLQSQIYIDYSLTDNIHQNNSLKGFLDLASIKLNNTIIIFLHKSPEYPTTKFKDILRTVLSRYTDNENISIVGDFNLDPSILETFMTNNNFLLNITGNYSTDYYTLIDLFYTNNPILKANFYESPISDHKPIYFQLH